MMLAAHTNHLRVRHGHSRVTFVELFFDLVFVFAVTQLSSSARDCGRERVSEKRKSFRE